MPVLNDITARLGGSQGQDGGLASLQRMFNANGGLQGMTSKLTNSGLGKQVQSWIGTGNNEPVNGTQVRQAVDLDYLNAMAKRAGLTPEETSEHIAQALPEMVDQATPQGQMPETDPFTMRLDSVKKMFKI